MARNKWTPETPWFKSRKKTQAVWPAYVCRNPQCRSYGKSHPGCECGAQSFSQQSKNLEYAEGGEVHYCASASPHQESCEHFASGGEVLDNQEFAGNPDLAVDHAIAEHGLLHALTKTGHSRSEDPNKPAEEFLAHSRRGKSKLAAHAKGQFDPKHKGDKIEKEEAEKLGEHIKHLGENPAELMDVGGWLGMPEHQGALAAKAATAYNYLNSLKPHEPAPGPLNRALPPDPLVKQKYTRQLGVAERPLSVLQRAKTGTLHGDDLRTLETLYPQLAKSIRNQSFGALVDHKTEGQRVSHAHRHGLSRLMGQPLDNTMTPQAMQATIQANAGATTETQDQGKRPGATAQTQKTMEKTDNLYKDPIERRLTAQK